MSPLIETNYYGIQSVYFDRCDDLHVADSGKIDRSRFGFEIEDAILIYVGDQVERRLARYLDPGHLRAVTCPSLHGIEPCSLKADLKFPGDVLALQIAGGSTELGRSEGHQDTRDRQNNQQFDNGISALRI